MPMFDDHLGLVQDDEQPRKELSPPRPSAPADRASTSSKPISIPAPTNTPYHSRRLSEESIRTELCEGPVSDSPPPLPLSSFSARPRESPTASGLHLPAEEARPHTPQAWDSPAPVSDRAELIERIKRGESPTWVPNRHLENLFHGRNSHSPSPSPRLPSADAAAAAPLLPAADITPERIPLSAHDHDAEATARLEDGLNIERPRSALHTGDFTERNTATGRRSRLAEEAETRPMTAQAAVSAGPNKPLPPFHAGTPTAWVATSPPRHYTPFTFEQHRSTPISSLAEIGVFRSSLPSPSSSLSSSFVYKPPTSPLVQSLSNDDDDDASFDLPMDNVDIARGSSPMGRSRVARTSSRRHTLTFSHLHHAPSLPYPAPFSAHMPSSRNTSAGSIRRDAPFPYQAHQPQRSPSATSAHNFEMSPSLYATSSPQTPSRSRSRRPSFTLDASPLQHASMVGSYEESILRGRMSTTPSKPLDFLAQIGVLGLGAKCKPSLRCPAHVTLPFSAVFYSYATTSYGRTKAEDGPSPYVGMVDLENGLPNSGVEKRSRRKALAPSTQTDSRTKAAHMTDTQGEEGWQAPNNQDTSEDVVMEDVHVERLDLSDSDTHKQTSSKSRSHRRRSQAPRAPPGGSYRIPEQGQLQIIIKNQNKTAVKLFLIPYDLTGMEPGTKTFVRQRSYSAGPIIDNIPVLGDSSADRPILRYLIHLHICCPSRGRYYLYKSIRVVFANRVPDGKEKLRNEITFPEPRYSPYKPIRVMHPPAGMAGGSGYHIGGGGGPGAALAAEKAYRRRSLGFAYSTNGVPQTFDAFGIHQGADLVVPPVPAIPMVPVLSAVPNPISSRRSTQAAAHAFSSHARINTPVDPLPISSVESPGSSSTSQFPSQTSASYAAAGDAQLRKGLSHGQPEIDEPQGGNSGTGDTGSTVELVSLPLYRKLSKGDIGYGGNAFVSGSPAACEGLLSQRLRSLGVEKGGPGENRTNTDEQ